MNSRPGPIAIIGQACRFPGEASSPESFWRMLMAGTDAVTTVPGDRFDQRRFMDADPGHSGHSYTFAAGSIGDVFGFDAGFFGISPREAREMDPQQRLLLELTQEALERAGLPPASLAGSDTAVYVGISGSDYAERRMGDPDTMDPYFMLGSTLSIAANRISYIFDLRGPSIAIDTACSSSLVALHEAVHALQSRRAGLAVVGGVNVLLSPAAFIGFSKAMMLAKDGRCRAFGEGGEGYVRAEGGGVLILKPLAQALSDGDPVLAVIRGVGVNTDGRTHGIALPSSASQEDLLRKVYRQAGLHPRRLSYFEAHGTGTAVGDPAEAGAIGRALSQRRGRGAPLPIGSVKSNLGHLEPASGMAGLMKAIGVLQHGIAPPSLHTTTLNPAIAFDALNLKVTQQAVTLGPQPRLVGVNSFGFGGTNAHVVLEQAPAMLQAAAPAARPLPLVLSARTAPALAAQQQAMRDWLEHADPASWHDIAYTAACRRPHHEHRIIVTASDIASAQKALSGAPLSPGAGRDVKTALIFSGNGAQWVGMGKRLLEEDAVFRNALAHIDSVAHWRLGWSVVQALSSGTAVLDDTAVAQPLLFALQVALVRSLEARGVTFDGTAGHSVGEVAAAHIAGILTLEQAVTVIRERSEAQGLTRAKGAMLAAAITPAAAAEKLAPLAGKVEIAAINSPRGVTLSGDTDAIAAFEQSLAAQGIASRRLDLDYAFHSHHQDAIETSIRTALASLAPSTGACAFYSTVTGARCDGTLLDADYWWRNIRRPVLFSDAITAMEQDGYRLFVEIGPASLLQGSLRQTLRSGGQAIPTLTRNDDGAGVLNRVRDQIYLGGGKIHFARLFPQGGQVVQLPTYAWQREDFRYQPTAEARVSFNSRMEAPLLGVRLVAQLPLWETTFTPDGLFADHKVEDAVLVPAAAFVEMALEAGGLLFGSQFGVEIERLEIRRPLVLDAPRAVRFRMEDAGFFTIESRERLRDGAWTAHATGRISALGNISSTTPQPDDAPSTISGQDHYAFTAACGFGYGPGFQVLDSARAGENSAQAQLALRQGDGGFRLHPALLDGLLQSVFPILRQRGGRDGAPFVPHKIARLQFSGITAIAARADIALTGGSPRAVIADGQLTDTQGRAIALLQGIRFTRLPSRAEKTDGLLYAPHLEPLAGLVPQPIPQSTIGAACQVLDAFQPDAARETLMNDVAAAFAADALLSLGDDAAPADRALMERLVAIVRRHPASLDEPEGLWRAAMAAHPELVMELALLGNRGRQLSARLKDGAPARAAWDDQAWNGPALGDARDALVRAAKAFAQNWPAHRRLRVLALGLSLDLGAGAYDIFAAPQPDQSFDLVVTLGPVPDDAAAPGGLLLQAVPSSCAWADLVFDGAAITPPAQWQILQTLEKGGVRFTAGTQPLADAPALAPRDWVLLGKDQALADALSSRGQSVRMYDGGKSLPLGMPLNLIYADGLDAPGLEAQISRCDELLQLLRDTQADIAALAVLTRSAVGPAGTDPAQALMVGLVRVLQNERPELGCRILDLAQGDHSAALADELVLGQEPEVHLAGAGRFGPRLMRLDMPRPPLAPDEKQVLEPSSEGLEGLSWVRSARIAPVGDEIEIAVAAAGLNFRDVMYAMRLLPDDILEGGYAGATLGLEAAGTVVRVGPDVTDLQPGQMVACFAPASLATHVITKRFAAAPLPAGMSAEAGATLMAGFFTVTYALAHLAQLRKGERVLIHGATGGVGLAAIQYAQHVGAEIFATAGNDEKRNFAALLGADHVLDSRARDFDAQIRALTNNQGVDVVLNSLAGDAMMRSLSLLRPFGRFLELGKVDFVANSRIGLASLRSNISYHGVDADQLISGRPDLAAHLFDQTMSLLAQGAFSPLPYRVFRSDQAVEAFRHMQRARHIGKIVLQTGKLDAQPAAAMTPVPIHADATYLITGGTSGFGLASAAWLAGHGARHLVLVNRSGQSQAPQIAQLRAQGVHVDLRACDVTDDAAVQTLVAEFGDRLKGVIHAATLYDDAPVSEMTRARFAAVVRPKAGGALALDKATRHLGLDIFLLYSSISAAIGNPGQANYVAANLALEALAAQRQKAGLAAQLVALGPIGNSGHLTLRADLAEMFQRIGLRPISTEEIFAKLDEAMLGGAPSLLVADVKWAKLASALPLLKGPRFAHLTGRRDDEHALENSDFAALAASLTAEELQARLVEEVTIVIARILQMQPERLNADASLFDLGMDSLMALELRMAAEERFGIELPAMAMAQDISIARLASRIGLLLTGAKTVEKDEAVTAQDEQSHILSRHAEHIASETISEAIQSLDVGQRPRLIP